MATVFVGALLAAGLFFALRHVYRNFRDNKNDCCGASTGCSGSCCGCPSQTVKK